MLPLQMIRDFKDKLKQGAVYGPFSKTCDPGFVEIVGHAGFDFIILDLEHGPNSVQTLQNLIRAAALANVLPIVRVKEGVHSVVGEVLDIGAAGIQVPQITSAQEAREIVQLAKFSPVGSRGVCRFVRAASYSALDRFAYFQAANEALVIVQLEGQQAIDNLQDIVNVPGIDVIFIGPYDLSQSLGVPGQIDHPLVENKMKEIIAACQQKGVYVGTFVDTLKNARKWRTAGVRYISYSVDVGLFYEQCSSVLNRLKQVEA